MAELYANNYKAYIQNDLAADTDDTTVVVSIAPPLALQAVGNWRLKIENEIFLVTNVDPDGVTLTIERGLEGTVVEEHAEGALATHVLTAGSLSNIIAEGPAMFNDNFDVTLQAAGIYTLPTAVGNFRTYIVKNTDLINNLTLQTTNSETIDLAPPGILIPLESVTMVSDNANWWHI